MSIVLSPRAEKQLKKISKIDQMAVARKIRSLKGNIYPKVEKLSGFKNIFRVRVGNYRIIFRKLNKEIYIILISHRKDVYRLLRQLFN